MRNKLLSMRNTVLALLAAIIIACLTFGVVTLTDWSSAYAETGDFTYDASDATVITGLSESGASKTSLRIPATVKKIADGAFEGRSNIVRVTFEANGDLTEIGESAFADTGISEIAIPAKVTKIGEYAFSECENLTRVKFEGEKVTYIGGMAFASCPSLNSVELPNLANKINYGEYVFDDSGNGGFYLIAKDKDDYLALNGTENLQDYVANITYPVTLRYVRDDVEIATEQRLFNADYGVQFINNMWIMTAIETVGPSSLKWYYEGSLVTVESVTALLSGDNGVGTGAEITLYSFDVAQKEFVARTDIVFDENAYYETSEINDLLASGSDKVEKGMKVEIVAFTPFGGGDDTIPDVIHDAGNYEIKITVGVVERTVKLTVAQKTVNLGDYSQLSWRIKGANGNTELREMALYVYVKDGREYPSDALLSDSQREDLGITSGSYTTRQVLYSAVRYTGNDVTLCIQNNPAFTVTYTGGEPTFREVGAYKATAKIVANPNYKLVNNSASNMRGLTITNSPDGSYAVTKNWYIVNMNNWLVDNDGADYKINNFIYGQNPGVSAPKLKYNNYNGTSPSFHLVLQLNGVQIGEAFTPAQISEYINISMPAGEYKLIATVGAVTSKESPDAEAVYHAQFTETCAFTVSKKTLLNLGNFIEALNGQEFVYKWDGKSHFYEQSAEVTAAYSNFLDNFVIPARQGVWKNYSQYFGRPEITYNLESMQSSEYFPAESVLTSDADTYVIYYKVTAPNYYDSLANSTEEKRKEYSFTVINVREVALPVIESKTYTGELVTADVKLPADDKGKPLYYTVLSNNGGINANDYEDAEYYYEVVLKLIDPVHYMWEGQTLSNRTETAKVPFTIAKSPNNAFIKTLGVTSWVVGRYDQLEKFPVVGEALYGDVEFKLFYSDDIENEIYSGLNRTEEFKTALMNLGTGTYILTASVEGSNNFNGITDVITFRVLEKEGLPWWATLLIVVGVLGIVATIFFILHQKGILQMLTGRVVIAMRTRATVDATIAAVRANKVAAAAKKTVAQAEARDRLEALREARANAKNMSAEEQAAALEEKAQAAAKSAEKLQKRAKNMQKRADKIKKQSDLQDAQAQAEQTVVSEEQSEQTSGEQPKEEN